MVTQEPGLLQFCGAAISKSSESGWNGGKRIEKASPLLTHLGLGETLHCHSIPLVKTDHMLLPGCKGGREMLPLSGYLLPNSNCMLRNILHSTPPGLMDI